MVSSKIARDVRLWHMDVDFILLVIFLVLANSAFLAADVYPIHDSFQSFANFHYFYSHLYHFGDLPRWNLYGSFGTPTAYWQLISLTPASYLLMGMGCIFRFQNVMLLWKLASLLDEVILLIGVYKLAKLLFQSRPAIFFVCAGVVGTTVLFVQVWFNFRIYYLIPLTLYFVFLFFLRSRPYALWLAGIVLLVSFIGNTPYFVVPWILCVGIVFIILSVRFRSAWSTLFSPAAANIASFIMLVAIAILLAVFVAYSVHGVSFGVERNQTSGMNDYSTFLTYGGQPDVMTLAQMLFLGTPLFSSWSGYPDNTLYMGVLPILMAALALIKVRDVRFVAMLGSAFLIIWFSSAGGLASDLYSVPGVALLRHLGLLFALARLLLIIAAGFGMEAIVSNETSLSRMMLALIIVLFCIDFILMRSLNADALSGAIREYFGIRIFFYLLPVYISLSLTENIPPFHKFRMSRGRQSILNLTVIALLFAYVIDLASFQRLIAQFSMTRLDPLNHPEVETTQVGPVPFALERRPPANERELASLKLATTLQEEGSTETLYGFTEFDPCFPKYHYALRPRGIAWLTYTLNLGPKRIPEKAWPILGCETSKFRLLANPIVVENIDQAANILSEQESLDQVLVLSHIDPRDIEIAGVPQPTPVDGTVDVIHATANEISLRINVHATQPVWLVYSDSYHSGWSVTVNSEHVPLAMAYEAFKAIRVQPGVSKVEFKFNQGVGPALVDIVALIGAIFAVIMLWIGFRLCFRSYQFSTKPDVSMIETTDEIDASV